MRAPLRLAAAALLAGSCAVSAPVLRADDAPNAPTTPARETAPPVVSGAWLEQRLASRDLVLLDARPFRDYLGGGHLPGAQSVLPDNLRSTSGGVPVAIYPPEVLGAVFARAGVTRGSLVVVYGGESDVDATFVATAARVAGATRVSVLDGGFSKWLKDLRPVRAERVHFPLPASDLRGEPGLLIPIDEVLKRVGDGRTVFLDVRSEEQWRAGHIPGAKSRPWKKDVENGSFRPEAAMRAELEAAGVSWERPVVVYCNSGHQASEGFYQLKYVLGHPDVRLYQGSWLEWSMTPGTPRESPAPEAPAPK